MLRWGRDGMGKGWDGMEWDHSIIGGCGQNIQKDHSSCLGVPSKHFTKKYFFYL